MQSFAHGRDGSRYLPAKELTYDKDGHPCAFVGAATHGMYLEDYVGRSKFADKVGNDIQERPSEFVDISCDKQSALESPGWQRIFQRMGSPASPTPPHIGAENVISYKDLVQSASDWNRYKPVLWLDKAWNKLKDLVRPKKQDTKLQTKLEVSSTASALEVAEVSIPRAYIANP
jgi:hypothetical protein